MRRICGMCAVYACALQHRVFVDYGCLVLSRNLVRRCGETTVTTRGLVLGGFALVAAAAAAAALLPAAVFERLASCHPPECVILSRCSAELTHKF